MSSFTDPLVIMPHGTQWITERPLDYEVGQVGMNLVIHVPSGFVTDLATIPRIFWSWLDPRDPRYAGAAVVHDYLCGTPGFNQRVADAIFLECLQVLGVGTFTRLGMYYAVRVYMTIMGDATSRAR